MVILRGSTPRSRQSLPTGWEGGEGPLGLHPQERYSVGSGRTWERTQDPAEGGTLRGGMTQEGPSGGGGSATEEGTLQRRGTAEDRTLRRGILQKRGPSEREGVRDEGPSDGGCCTEGNPGTGGGASEDSFPRCSGGGGSGGSELTSVVSFCFSDHTVFAEKGTFPGTCSLPQKGSLSASHKVSR